MRQITPQAWPPGRIPARPLGRHRCHHLGPGRRPSPSPWWPEEWLETGDNRRAVRVGLAETSRVINSAAVIMISVFLAFVLSGDRVIAMFGIALAAAVALDAFVLRTLLVPALMHMLGTANWWLPRRLDRILPHISIEPPECRHARIPEQSASDELVRQG